MPKTIDSGEIMRRSNEGSTPVPDPTVLTTQQLLREILSIKELFNTRLDAMDKAIVLLQANADRSPTIAVVDQRLTATTCLMHSKFKEYDTRVEEIVEASKNGVDAAFAAQKEAINKSETGFTKQIDNMGGQMHMLQKTFDDKINDIKDRLDRLSGQYIGSTSSTAGKEEGGKAVWAIVGAGIGIMISLVPILSLLFTRGT